MANLINFGIMPLMFNDMKDYDHLQNGDRLEIADTQEILRDSEFVVVNKTRQAQIIVRHKLTMRQAEIVLQGGLLNYIGTR